MSESNGLVLVQYREDSTYNDFIGKYYHFPKSYINNFKRLPIGFIYYEPVKNGKGEFFGFGRIMRVFKDKKDKDFYYAEISDYKPFTLPVSYRNDRGEVREAASPHYNPQNAVRKIPRQLLEDISLDGAIQLNFKADAHLIKVLGEQLIASEKVGILELIKNAYDAHASYCRVRIERVDTLPAIEANQYEFDQYPGPVIVIEDDGKGMTRDDIERGWLRPASVIKTNVKERLKREREEALRSGTLGTYESLVSQLKKEYRNRIPLGEKGVGRFATHRLGTNLIIKTKIQELDYEYVLKIDWTAFDSMTHVDLDSVGIALTRSAPSRDYGSTGSGTQVIIFGGREGFEWNEKTIRDINQSIVRLNSPNPKPDKIQNVFRAYMECPQIENLPQEQVFEVFTPTFEFEGLVNSKGILELYTLKFIPPPSVPMAPVVEEEENYDLKVATKDYWKRTDATRRNPECGGFYFHIEAWYRRKPWIDGPNTKDMIGYLDTYGGISIYRDDLLIFPAESGSKNDWLELSTRHIKKGKNISYYNFIGNVEIEQTENLGLIDKTDREGMLENTSFRDLGQLMQAIIHNILEPAFIAKRDEFTNLTKGLIREPQRLTGVTKQSAQILSNIKDRYPLSDDPFELLEELRPADERPTKLINLARSMRELRESLRLIEEVQELLTEQAGYGLAVAVSVHEIAKITSNFYNGVNLLLKAKKIDKSKLQDLRDASESLQSELKRLGPLRAIRNESKTEFNVLKSLNFTRGVFRRKLKEADISFDILGNDDFQVYARYGAINQVLTNLADNSVYWLDTADSEDKRIVIRLDSEFRTLTFADNGPGVKPSIRPHLFEPGYSLKVPPSGLGLYICKHYMQDIKGDIYETISRERIEGVEGAQFTLDFGRVPSNKEEA